MTEIFEGVRVVELAQYVFVPAASALLADHGAEVIKIEPPVTGDPYRTLKVGDGRETATANLAMEQNNRGKKSVAIDLKNEEGREALLRLCDTADVFITSLRPLALKALRLEPDDLMARNPRIIYARGNGLGFKGAEFNKAGYDVPTRPRPALGDHSSAISLLAGIASALFRRERSGKGMVVETSLLQNAAWILSSDLVYSRNNKAYDPHAGFANGHRAPLMRAYKTSDGRFIQLMLLAPDKPWPELCAMIGQPELASDPRFVTNALRIENGAELCGILDEAFRAHTWAHWAPLFLAWNAPWELISNLEELGNDPQLAAAGTVFKMQLKNGEIVDVVAGPIGFDEQAAPTNPVGSPDLGEHSDEVLRSIGFSAEELARLRDAKVIG